MTDHEAAALWELADDIVDRAQRVRATKVTWQSKHVANELLYWQKELSDCMERFLRNTLNTKEVPLSPN
jgi:hypothetical protein